MQGPVGLAGLTAEPPFLRALEGGHQPPISCAPAPCSKNTQAASQLAGIFAPHACNSWISKGLVSFLQAALASLHMGQQCLASAGKVPSSVKTLVQASHGVLLQASSCYCVCRLGSGDSSALERG